MAIIYLLLPLSLLLAVLGFFAYLWSVRSGQFDDLETPQLRMLFDDEPDRVVKNAAENATDESGKGR